MIANKKKLRQVGSGPVTVLLVYAGIGALIASALYMVGSRNVVVQQTGGGVETLPSVPKKKGGRNWVQDGKYHYQYHLVTGDKGNEYVLVYKYKEEDDE